MKHHSVRTWSFATAPTPMLAFTVAALVAVSPTFAGPPERNAAKMLASPLVELDSGESPGLPPVTCGGFAWYNAPPPPPGDPMDETTLDLSLIPFREGPTSIRIFGGSGLDLLARVFFDDGLVQGLPYDRNDWNRVTITMRPLTQDSLLTVNGQAAPPVPFDDGCAQGGGCAGVLTFFINGEFLHEGTGWVDSVQLMHGPPADPDPDLFFDMSFDGTCGTPFAGYGAVLISAPPRNAKPRTAAASPTIVRGVKVRPAP